MEKRKKIQYISFLQLIGPIFVILGHSLNGISSDGVWWILTKKWIYIFHMPLFFMISGYLLSYGNWMKEKGYVVFIKNKFMRLMVPYLVWNGICYIPKYFAQGYLADDVQMNFAYLLKVFFSPRQNIWGHTWFLAGLFIVYLFTPIWKKIFSNITKLSGTVFIAIGIALYIIPIRTEIFCLSDLHKDILFFGMGCILGTISVDKLKKIAKKTFIFNITVATVTSLVCIQILNNESLWFIPCTFILLTLLSVGFYLDGHLNNTFIKYSRRSFGIYIMHWPVMVVSRILFMQILGFNTVVTVIVMIFAGIIIPNIILSILDKINLEKFSKVMKYLLGV